MTPGGFFFDAALASRQAGVSLPLKDNKLV